MRDDLNESEWCPPGGKHIVDLTFHHALEVLTACHECGAIPLRSAKYCSKCGRFIEEDIAKGIQELADVLRSLVETPEVLGYTPLTEEQKRARANFVFPTSGVYVLFHPYEGYKIGQAENIRRRIEKLMCSAPSLELLHVIETSDMDWCERFLHGRFQSRRLLNNREYFDLTRDDIEWLFSIRVLEPPRTAAQQHSLLDLL